MHTLEQQNKQITESTLSTYLESLPTGIIYKIAKNTQLPKTDVRGKETKIKQLISPDSITKTLEYVNSTDLFKPREKKEKDEMKEKREKRGERRGRNHLKHQEPSEKDTVDTLPVVEEPSTPILSTPPSSDVSQPSSQELPSATVEIKSPAPSPSPVESSEVVPQVENNQQSSPSTPIINAKVIGKLEKKLQKVTTIRSKALESAVGNQTKSPSKNIIKLEDQIIKSTNDLLTNLKNASTMEELVPIIQQSILLNVKSIKQIGNIRVKSQQQS